MRQATRPAVHLARGLPLYAQLARMGRDGPLAVFLPNEGRRGAALLRCYNMADALRPLGWRCLVIPATLTLSQRIVLINKSAPDILVMQGSRHWLNRPEFFPGLPIAYDMDDADFHLPHLAEPVRHAMPAVATVIAGSCYISDWCRAAGAGEAHVVWTGAPVSATPRPPQETRPPVIAWAQTRPMTYVREAGWVRRVASGIAARNPGVRLRLYDRQKGDDRAFAASFEAPGLTVEWRRIASYSDYLRSLSDVAIGFAPLCPETPFSRGKSFGKVLAYLDREVPVIASRAGEHPAFFTGETGIVSNDCGVWIAEALRLLQDPRARAAQATAAFAAFRDRLSVEAASARVDRILQGVITR